MTDADFIEYVYEIYGELTDLIRLATTLQGNLKRQSEEKGDEFGNGNGLSRCEHNIALLVKMQANLAKLQDQGKRQEEGAAGNQKTQVKTGLEALLQAGRWHGTFWQVFKQRIEALLMRPNSLPAQQSVSNTQASDQKNPTALPADQTKASETTCVFMHIYQATGKSLAAWLPQLQNLESLAQSRPIYTNRSDVLAVLEARGQVSTDAYVAINLPADVLVEAFRGQTQTDKYGHTLATLDMDRWPAQPHIDHFYHQQHTYHLYDNELTQVQ